MIGDRTVLGLVLAAGAAALVLLPVVWLVGRGRAPHPVEASAG